MATLDLIRWQLHAPDIGANRDPKRSNAERLFLEVAVGLSQAQLDDVDAKLKALPDGNGPDALDALNAAVGQWVRLRGGPHTVGGQQVGSLRELLGVVPPSMVAAISYMPLRRFNSIGGQQALFFARSSGGSPTTDDLDGA